MLGLQPAQTLTHLLPDLRRLKSPTTFAFVAAAAFALTTYAANSALAQAPGTPGVYTSAVAPQQAAPQQFAPPQLSPQQPAISQHPLAPAMEWAAKIQQNIEQNVKDYSATIEKREQIDGKLGDPEYAIIKVRNHPFSVYMSFLAPEKVKGQECLFVEGQNNDKMFAHAPPGTLRGKFGTVQISPTSAPPCKASVTR